MDEPARLVLHPNCKFILDEEFECPLRSSRINFERIVLGEIEDSARQGCPACILRYAAVNQHWPGTSRTTKITYSSGHDRVYTSIRKHSSEIILAWDPPSTHPDTWRFYQHSLNQVGRGDVQRLLPFDTKSDRSLRTALRWINICDEGHDCVASAEGKLPRRVLDVRNGRVRLHSPPETEQAKYACLSHCWGTKTMVQTTSKNISSFAQEIPWSAMPRTFQDAVSFVRKLSIAYLWIDSLCIIQDSDLDWQQQSANMASIYQNAYITLAATHSADSSGGCFTSDSLRSTHDYEPLAILRFHDGTEHNLSFRRTLIRSSQPLLWRGWAYQERILSPRVLHFAGEELVWECGTVYDSESNSHNFKAFFFHSKQDRNIRWGRIVQDYFRRSLTFPSDIFPALSGIVKVVAAQLQDEYAAGLWKRTIIQDLLWYFTTRPGSTDLSTTATTAEVWRAPSWSWASMTTPARDLNIQYLPASQNLAEVTNIVCKPAGADTTGQLAMAHLTISAKALLGHLVCSSPPTARHSPYEVIVGNFAIRKSPWYESNEATHFGLDSFHHTHHLEPLEVIIVQLAKHTDITKTHVPRTSEDIETVHEVRSYMILTRDSTDPDHWIRIGLVAIDIVEPAPSLRDDVRDSVQITGEGDPQQQQALASFVAELQQEASLPRQLTHLFAEAETQEFVVW